MRYNRGFTLLEVLVALAVFALIASITSSAMYHAFNTRTRVTSQADRLLTLQLAIAIMNRDTEQLVDRGVMSHEMHRLASFIGQTHYLEFTRNGEANPGGIARSSTLKRVAYLCQNSQLIRRSWEALDTPQRQQYHDNVLLNHIKDCQFAYLAQSQMQPDWRQENNNEPDQNTKAQTQPSAIQLNLTLDDWGKMSLLFIIIGADDEL